MDPRTAVYKRYWVDFLFLLPFICRSTKHKASEGQLRCVGKPILRSSALVDWSLKQWKSKVW